MKKKRHSKARKHSKKNTRVLPLLIITMAVIVVIGFAYRTFKQPSLKIASIDSRDSLQLESFSPAPTILTPTPTKPPQNTPPPEQPTPTPTPIQYNPPPPVDNGTCAPDSWITDSCTCIGSHEIYYYCDGTAPPNAPDHPPSFPRGCVAAPGPIGDGCRALMKNHPECTQWCELKPVIYLYPKVKTLVNVEIQSPGRVFVSNPLYPSDGWKNVWAEPNGTLTYQGKTYKELFYELEHKNVSIPKDGIVIKRQDLRLVLEQEMMAYGLNINERNEFLDFWVPKLMALNKPYIQFSVFPYSEKVKMDKIVMNPEADTRIEVIAYFKGLDQKIQLPTPSLPNPPERTGFVMVAWGGIIAK